MVVPPRQFRPSDAVPWSGPPASVRRDGQRPNLAVHDSRAAAHDRAAAVGADAGAARRDRSRPSNPNLASTVIGPVPVAPEPPPVPCRAHAGADGGAELADAVPPDARCRR